MKTTLFWWLLVNRWLRIVYSTEAKHVAQWRMSGKVGNATKRWVAPHKTVFHCHSAWLNGCSPHCNLQRREAKHPRRSDWQPCMSKVRNAESYQIPSCSKILLDACWIISCLWIVQIGFGKKCERLDILLTRMAKDCDRFEAWNVLLLQLRWT